MDEAKGRAVDRASVGRLDEVAIWEVPEADVEARISENRVREHPGCEVEPALVEEQTSLVARRGTAAPAARPTSRGTVIAWLATPTRPALNVPATRALASPLWLCETAFVRCGVRTSERSIASSAIGSSEPKISISESR